MSDVENLLDELNGRLTAVWAKHPETYLFIWSLQKHIKYALENPKEVRLGKLMEKAKDWLRVQQWKHPIFRDEFQVMIDRIGKFEDQ